VELTSSLKIHYATALCSHAWHNLNQAYGQMLSF